LLRSPDEEDDKKNQAKKKKKKKKMPGFLTGIVEAPQSSGKPGAAARGKGKAGVVTSAPEKPKITAGR
jgi:hypothetical protein